MCVRTFTVPYYENGYFWPLISFHVPGPQRRFWRREQLPRSKSPPKLRSLVSWERHLYVWHPGERGCLPKAYGADGSTLPWRSSLGRPPEPRCSRGPAPTLGSLGDPTGPLLLGAPTTFRSVESSGPSARSDGRPSMSVLRKEAGGRTSKFSYKTLPSVCLFTLVEWSEIRREWASSSVVGRRVPQPRRTPTTTRRIVWAWGGVDPRPAGVDDSAKERAGRVSHVSVTSGSWTRRRSVKMVFVVFRWNPFVCWMGL